MKTLISAALISLMTGAAAYAEGDAAEGEADFKKCKACHAIANGDEVIQKGGKTGPNLYGMIGRQAGSVEDFKYGKDLVAVGEAGLIWDEASIVEYLADPAKFLKARLDDGAAKSKMSFKLSKGAEDMAAYLVSVSPEVEDQDEVTEPATN